jgi:hypothetical protein
VGRGCPDVICELLGSQSQQQISSTMRGDSSSQGTVMCRGWHGPGVFSITKVLTLKSSGGGLEGCLSIVECSSTVKGTKTRAGQRQFAHTE